MTPVLHPLTDPDRAVMAQMREMSAPMKGVIDAAAFDDMVEQVPPAEEVTYDAAHVGGVAGWWVRPGGDTTAHSAILYLHGGAYIVGTAKSYRNFVGHIARSAGFAAFIPDYRLAAEHPFPAAVEDAQSAYRGLGGLGFTDIALVGDSAGGGLALVLLALAAKAAQDGGQQSPRSAVVMSPWTDLALMGATMKSKAEADPFLTRAALLSAAQQYLGPHDPHDPLASPLDGDLAGLPPVMIHVGDDEVLLDDALRYGERLAAAGGDVQVHQWMGMPHVFTANIALLSAARSAVEMIGRFLRDGRAIPSPASHP